MLTRTIADQRAAVRLALKAKPDKSNVEIAEHCGVKTRLVCLVRHEIKTAKSQTLPKQRLRLKQNRTGTSIQRAMEIMKSHRVSRATAFRWIAANDVPPVDAMRHYGAVTNKTKIRSVRKDRDVPESTVACRALYSAASFLRIADRNVCEFGIDLRDLSRLSAIFGQAQEMLDRWGKATS